MSAARAPSAVFRADASPEGGGGHVVRCLALADGLAARGWRCVLATDAASADTVPALARSGHERITLDGGHDEPAAIVEALPGGTDWLVVDHYGRGPAFEAACRRWAGRILAVDERPAAEHDCDVLVDQSPGRGAEYWRGRVPAECRLLLGPDHALLRPAFARHRDASLRRRRDAGRAERLLVAFGAGDDAALARRAVAAAEEAAPGRAVDVVLGATPSAEPVPGGDAVAVHRHVADMAGLMAGCDLAVGAAGVSTWERCCLGLPSVAITLADNQHAAADWLHRSGAGLWLGDAGEVTAAAIAGALAGLCDDGPALRAMARTAAEQCDGRGVERAIEVMNQG